MIGSAVKPELTAADGELAELGEPTEADDAFDDEAEDEFDDEAVLAVAVLACAPAR